MSCGKIGVYLDGSGHTSRQLSAQIDYKRAPMHDFFYLAKVMFKNEMQQG